MNPLTLSQITVMCGGKLLAGDPEAQVTGVSTDSRKVVPGELFVALQGEKFDGHLFLPEVSSRGATAVLVQDYPRNLSAGCGVILVTDTLDALQNLARNYRRELTCQIVGITGSNGKTSVKDLTAGVLGSHWSVAKTQGNLNNHIGLPLSVLSIDARHQAAVLEMGMNHPGEIAPLAAIAAPDLAIITNIGIAHIEYMGSRDAIALEKGMLAEAVGPRGTVILPANDDMTPSIFERCQARVLTAGIEAGDVQVRDLQLGLDRTRFTLSAQGHSVRAFLPIPGRHMAGNAALAVAAGLALSFSLVDCAEALEGVRLTGGRLEIKQIAGLHFLDDSYNANPDSMIAALGTLTAMPVKGRRIAVLGAMGELGSHSEEGHRQVGAETGELDILIVVGETAAPIAEAALRLGNVEVFRVEHTGEAVELLHNIARDGDTILVKGSRSTRMERVIQAFQNTAPSH